MRDTIDMAREAGMTVVDDEYSLLPFLERFEALVRADEREEFQRWFVGVITQHEQLILAEREACAKVCEENANDLSEGDWDPACNNCAYHIRARGETK